MGLVGMGMRMEGGGGGNRIETGMGIGKRMEWRWDLEGMGSTPPCQWHLGLIAADHLHLLRAPSPDP